MSLVKSVLRAGVSNAIGQVASYSAGSIMESSFGSMKSFLPKVEVPDALKGANLKFNTNAIKLPAGVDSYISPILSGFLSNVNFPTEVNGVPIPKLPDFSSVSSDVSKHLSGIGFDTDKLGIRSIDEILQNPDISSLKSVQFESPIDPSKIPSLSDPMSGFDISSIQKEIDSVTTSLPDIDGLESVDVSKYF